MSLLNYGFNYSIVYELCTFIYDSVNYGMQIVLSFLLHWLISQVFIENTNKNSTVLY